MVDANKISHVGCFRRSFERLGLVVENHTKLGVDNIVHARGVLARQRFLFVVARLSGLVEDCLVTADERELGGFDHLSKIVFDGQTHVEDFAVVVNISVETEGNIIGYYLIGDGSYRSLILDC